MGNHCFFSDLSERILDADIDLWLHGHTHTAFDYKLGKTRVLCNPRGYEPGEHTGYNPKLRLDLSKL